MIRSVKTMAALLACALSLSGCMTTRNSVFVEVNNRVMQRDYAGAIDELGGPNRKKYYSDNDAVLYHLDVGVLYQLAGDQQQSSANLGEAERLIEENYTKSVTGAAASFLINDYAMAYAGEAFEDIYLNVFKCLNYAKERSLDGAFVEMRKVGNKLNLLEDRYGKLAKGMNSSKDAGGAVKVGKTEFHNSALARFIGIVLYRADGKQDDAALELKKLKQAFKDQPNVYNFPAPNLDGMLAATKKARLDLVGFTGQSPAKRAYTVRIMTSPNLLTITYEKENTVGRMELQAAVQLQIPGIDGGYFFKCQLPEMIARPSAVGKIAVLVDGQPAGELALLESIENAAIETFKLKADMVFTKTVIRTAVKGIVAAKAKEAINKQAAGQGTAGLLLGFAAGLATDVAVEASEQADLRCANFFPGNAWVGEVLVDPGKRTVSLQYFDKNGALVYQDDLGERDVGAKTLNLFPSYALFK